MNAINFEIPCFPFVSQGFVAMSDASVEDVGDPGQGDVEGLQLHCNLVERILYHLCLCVESAAPPPELPPAKRKRGPGLGGQSKLLLNDSNDSNGVVSRFVRVITLCHIHFMM